MTLVKRKIPSTYDLLRYTRLNYYYYYYIIIILLLLFIYFNIFQFSTFIFFFDSYHLIIDLIFFFLKTFFSSVIRSMIRSRFCQRHKINYFVHEKSQIGIHFSAASFSFSLFICH